jgi:hypothetical protein
VEKIWHAPIYRGDWQFDAQQSIATSSNIAAYVILRTITRIKPVCVTAEEKKIEAAWDALLSGTK